MKTQFLATLVVIAAAFTACKKDNDQNPGDGAALPKGQYRLIEMHQLNAQGKDSATVEFPVSGLSLTFDQAKQTANVSGKPENIQLSGSYTVSDKDGLKDVKISTSKIAPGENDMKVVQFLELGQQFENKGRNVIIHTKDKGYLVFSMQK
ncbi:hypothetical protein DBR43_05570 [Pedobacter sp. KBW06]|uniref:hypothetical protein n=1 Tax=Pedobacter sp. KBW06 TaxID=2153359 RepID=UPI000F59EBDA|nr:hypothetical protein [Pedobacter sp. KBW06]RQO74849.1 hypothetical protein DBR43_05570 [Pedobacter sp. KBW06]